METKERFLFARQEERKWTCLCEERKQTLPTGEDEDEEDEKEDEEEENPFERSQYIIELSSVDVNET